MTQTTTPLINALQGLFGLVYFADVESDEEAPIRYRFEPGDPSSRLLVVTGENAGGKSYFVSLFAAYVRKRQETEGIIAGMRQRTESGLHRVFMFGDESWESTGVISTKCVRGALRTSAEREKPHYLVLDEPEVGLGQGYQRAMGEWLGRFAVSAPENTRGLVITSHSRPLVRELLQQAEAAGQPAHRLRIGDDLRPTAEWLEHGPAARTAADLEALMQLGTARFREVSALINS